MTRFKEPLRRLAGEIAVRTGMAALGRALRTVDGAVILYTHRVSGDDEGYLEGTRPQWFAEQVAYLARHFELISLSTLVQCFEERREVPHRSAVLTFDDGFRDNLESALPVLEKHRAPATIFLVTGCLDTGELPWSQRLGYMLQHTPCAQARLGAGSTAPVDVASPAARRQAYSVVKEQLKPLPRASRERALDALAAELQVTPPRDRMLSWDDARALRASGLELGAHTVSHPWLARIPWEESLAEMRDSRDALRDRLGVAHPSFAFPAGSYTPELIAAAREMGFRSAFQRVATTRVNRLGTVDQFSLVRIGLPDAPGTVLAAELDGPLPAVRSLLQRARGGR